MRKEFDIIIRGKVQMVMYRDFAQKQAHIYSIVGSVQNLEDGSVHIVAQGEEKDIVRYIELLKEGPTLAHVESVEVTEKKNLGNYAIFNIIF